MLGLILKIRLMLLRIVTIAFFISNTTKIVLKKLRKLTDCHMEEFAELLSALAIKLGIVPEVGWLEELLHILIEGVHIENEVGDACTDYGDGNWAGFGYNVAKLVKTLV